MIKQKDYKVLVSQSLKELQDTVNGHLLKGYVVSGCVFEDGLFYCQPVVLPCKETTNTVNEITPVTNGEVDIDDYFFLRLEKLEHLNNTDKSNVPKDTPVPTNKGITLDQITEEFVMANSGKLAWLEDSYLSMRGYTKSLNNELYQMLCKAAEVKMQLRKRGIILQ